MRRIEPANLRDLPSAIDTEQASNVLRMSVERVRAFTADPASELELADPYKLHRLAYSQTDWLYWEREIERFFRAWSKVGGLRDSA